MSIHMSSPSFMFFIHNPKIFTFVATLFTPSLSYIDITKNYYLKIIFTDLMKMYRVYVQKPYNIGLKYSLTCHLFLYPIIFKIKHIIRCTFIYTTKSSNFFKYKKKPSDMTYIHKYLIKRLL